MAGECAAPPFRAFAGGWIALEAFHARVREQGMGGALGIGSLALVALGGAFGSVLRYLVSVAGVALWGTAFPWGTLAVNILGSACIGIAGGVGLEGQWRLLLVTGVLGGFTTFSAFSLETGLLFGRAWWLAAAYVAASLVLGLAAFALCFVLARRI
jgi:CrcB protein